MSEGPPAAPAVPAQDQDEGTSQPTSDDAVPLTAAEGWVLTHVRAHFLAHIHQEHPKFKQDVEDGACPRWSLLDKPELAEELQCTEDELEKAHKDMKKRFLQDQEEGCRSQQDTQERQNMGMQLLGYEDCRRCPPPTHVDDRRAN